MSDEGGAIGGGEGEKKKKKRKRKKRNKNKKNVLAANDMNEDLEVEGIKFSNQQPLIRPLKLDINKNDL